MSEERESERGVPWDPSACLRTLTDGCVRTEGNYVGQLEGFHKSCNLSPLEACLLLESDR